jgi:hypothetical protein
MTDTGVPAATGSTTIPSTTSRPGGPLSCRASAWLADTPVRAGAVPEWITTAAPGLVAAAEAALRPADDRAWAVALDRLLSHAALHDLPVPRDIQAVSRSYRSLLHDLPADVLMAALEATLARWTWRMVPQPGDVRRHAAAELSRRRTILIRARQVRMLARDRRPPDPPRYADLSPAERERVDRLLAAARSALES